MTARPALPSPVVMVDDIITAVCSSADIERLDLISERRHGHLVAARRVVALVASRLTLKGTPTIGRLLNRDRATVLQLTRTAERVYAESPDFRAVIQGVEIAALTLALARAQGVIKTGRAEIDPYLVARQVVADGLIKACRISLDEIMAMSVELDRIRSLNISARERADG